MNKRNIKKQIFAGLLSVLLIVSILPAVPAAAEGDVEVLCTCTPVEGIHAENCPLFIPAEPAETDPPVTDPPATDPPVTDPPVTDPPATEPPEMAAVIYTDKGYSVQDVNLASSKTLSGWDEGTNRYLKVSLSNLDQAASYRLVVYTDPAIYATNLNFTGQNWDESQHTTRHGAIAVNNGGTYTPNANSGTTVYTVKTGTTGLDLNLELNYDWVFWDRSANAPLGYYAAYRGDTAWPLVTVELQKVTDTVETIAARSLNRATAGRIKNTAYTAHNLTIQTSDNAPATTLNKNQTFRFHLSSFYNFLCRDLTFKVTLPRLEYDGTVYSMEPATGHSFPVTGGSADYTFTEEATSEGKRIATFRFKNLYTTSAFRDICFKLPSDAEAIKTLEEAADSHRFTGGKIEIYRGTELIGSIGDIAITVATRSGGNKLMTSVGPLTGTNQSVAPAIDTPTMSAIIYTNKEYTVQDVDLSTTTALSGWDEEDNRYLKVSLGNLDQTASYKLVVYTDPAIYATNLDFTNQNWDESQKTTKHAKISVNKNGTYTPKANSGTTTYTVKSGTTGLDLNLELNYDWVFWDRSTNAPLGYFAAYQGDTSKPLISIELQKVTGTDTVETISTLSLDSATAGQIENTVYTAQSQTILDSAGGPASTINAQQTVQFRLASYYNFLCKDLTFKVTLPHLEYDGTMYSMELAAGHSFPATGGSANYTLTEEKTAEGVNVATFRFTDLYTTSNFRYIYFRLPTDTEAIKTLEAAAATHNFTGGKIEVYRGTERIRTLSNIEIQMVRSGVNIIEYEKAGEASRRNKASIANLGKIQYLDVFAPYNSGTVDSGPVTVHAVFDSNNKKAIGVTAMRLMAPKGKSVTVKCTMVDSEGTVHEYPDLITLKNTSTEAKGDKYGILFSRADLAAPYNTYHFKTITYVTVFPAGMHLFDSDNLQSPTRGGGTVWGEVLVDTVPATANRSKNTYYVYDGDFRNADFNESKLLEPVTRTVTIQGNGITQQLASYGIYTPRVSLPGGAKVKEVSIDPGESAVITAQVQVANYPYTTKSSIDNLRIGLRLPLGATINRADLAITLKDGTAVDVKQITFTQVQVKDSVENFWLIELDPDVEIGYYGERLDALPSGAVLNLRIPIQTELTTLAGRIKVDDVLYVAAYGQGQGVTGGNLKNFRTADIYGMLGPCTGLDSKYKFVGFCRTDQPENVYINIGAPNAELDITDSFVGSKDGKSLTMKQHDETLQYKLDVNCNTGGTVSSFYYYIPVPKADCESRLDFVDETNGLSLNLTGPVELTFSDSETPLKVMYTTDANLTYANAGAANWKDANQISADNAWYKVTMMKLAPVDASASMKNGTSVHVLASFRFDGDAKTYAQSAGAQFQWKSKGFYNCNLGVGAIQGTYPTAGVSLDLSYTAPVQKLTLTAAKDRKPTTAGAEKAVLDLNELIGGNFVNTPTFTIRNIATVGDLTLVASSTNFAAMTSADSNTKFAATARLNAGTAKDLIAGSTVTGMAVPADGAAAFTFEIYNGNVITENAQTKKVTLELVGSNGAIIPVEITVLRELAAAEPKNPGILGGKQYSLFDDVKSSISVRKSSAFTAQFVADLIPQNYNCPVLTVSGNPTGPLIMIDWTDSDSPKYYEASIPSGGALPLTSFTRIGGSGSYAYSAYDGQVTQALLFVFDEAGSTGGTVTLAQTAKAGGSISQTLTYTVSNDRSFGLSGGGATTSGTPVTVNYSTDTGAPTGANDSYYQNRNLALVVSGTGAPADLYLIAGGKTYYGNPDGEFIIPLGDIQSAGNGSISITPVTDAKNPGCTLSAQLWASATDSGSNPHKGQPVGESVTITVTGTGASPALKVKAMSDRMITLSELSAPVTVEVQKANFASGTKVELTVQVKEGNGYVTRAAVLDKQTGLTNNNGTDTVELVFNVGTAIGTYRLLFTITNGAETMEVPYNFLVLED